VDLAAMAAERATIALDWRRDNAGRGPVVLELGGGALDLSKLLRGLPKGEAMETRIPLRCFAAADADLTEVGAPFRMVADAGLAITLRTVAVDEGAGDTGDRDAMAATTAAGCPAAVR
jgi:beta-glucosidase